MTTPSPSSALSPATENASSAPAAPSAPARISRRTVVRGTAWAMPAVLTATSAPAATASPTLPVCLPGTPPENSGKMAITYPRYAWNEGQTVLDDGFYLDMETGDLGARFSGNTEMVGAQQEGVLAPFVEVSIRKEFGRMDWVPNPTAFRNGWKYAGATGPRRAADGFSYYTYKFTNSNFFTNFNSADPRYSKFQFAAYPQDVWTGPRINADQYFNTYTTWTFPTQIRACSPTGTPMMTTTIQTQTTSTVGVSKAQYFDHVVDIELDSTEDLWVINNTAP